MRKRICLYLLPIMASFTLLFGTQGEALAQTTLSKVQGAYNHAKQQASLMDEKLRVLGAQEAQASDSLKRFQDALTSANQVQEHIRVLLAKLKAQSKSDALQLQHARRQAWLARNSLRRQLIFWYEEGSQPYFEVVLSAKSLSDLWNRYVALSFVAQKQDEIVKSDMSVLAHYQLLLQRDGQDKRRMANLLLEALNKTRAIQAATIGEARVLRQLGEVKKQTAQERMAELRTMQRLASRISALEQMMQAQKERQKEQNQSLATSTPAAVSQDLMLAVKDVGVPSSWVPWLAILVTAESGGNPNAVSPFAVHGEYASGLLQMLPTTFAQYAQPGHTDIWNPVDNAIAAIRYIEASYGAPWRIPGIGTSSYQGY